MKKYPGSVGSRAPIAEAALNIYGEIAPGILTKELGLEPTYTGDGCWRLSTGRFICSDTAYATDALLGCLASLYDALRELCSTHGLRSELVLTLNVAEDRFPEGTISQECLRFLHETGSSLSLKNEYENGSGLLPDCRLRYGLWFRSKDLRAEDVTERLRIEPDHVLEKEKLSGGVTDRRNAWLLRTELLPLEEQSQACKDFCSKFIACEREIIELLRMKETDAELDLSLYTGRCSFDALVLPRELTELAYRIGTEIYLGFYAVPR